MVAHRILLMAVVSAAALAGCAKPIEVASITEIKSNTGSQSVDVHAPRRTPDNTGVPEFAGDQIVEVRTYVWEDGTGEVEIAGAACNLSAADFSADMTTPAKVRVPLYRAQSSQLAVACEKDGFKKRMITIAAFDATRTERMSSSANTGLIGLVAVTAIDAMSDNTKNEWRYPLARVVLEREAPQRTAAAR